MGLEASDRTFVPEPLHRALDHLTATMVGVQHLQRRIDHDAMLPPDEIAVALAEIDEQLRQLSVILIETHQNSQNE